MGPHVVRASVLAVSVAFVGAACSPGRAPSAERLSTLSSERRAALEREAQRVGKPFDAPDEALAFYVNKRTGPITTRGDSPTRGVRTLDPSAYLPALQHMRGMPRYSTATGAVLPSYDEDPGLMASPGGALGTWRNLGPANQGGRTRALLIDPANPKVMYAGGVAGGVWKSTNSGATWTTATDLQMPNLAVTSLEFDPQDSDVIYAGTGEGMFNFAAVRGAGIFKSLDAGDTWQQLASTATADFHYVNSLVVSPRNNQRIFAATRTGLYRTTDGGASWTELVQASGVNGCTQVALQRTGASGYVFASCGNFAQGTVYRATDDDTSSFTSVLSDPGMGRSSIAIAPSLESTVYVMSASTTAGGAGVHGLHALYRSASDGDPGSFTTETDGKGTGTSFPERLGRTLLSNPVYAFLADCSFGAASQFLNQGWYDNVLAVDPVDPDRVWAGGIDLFRSDDRGRTWGVAGYWWFAKGVDPEYHHADQHAIVFHPGYDGTTNKVMFSASDGGIERIDDAQATTHTTLAAICGAPAAGAAPWIDRNSGYVTTQFYDGTPSPDGATYFGGTQDNGTQRGSTASPDWALILGGDGGYVAIDTLSDSVPGNDVLFGEFTRLSIQKSTNNGATFFDAVTGITESASNFGFIAPFTMNTGFKQHLWTGGFFIWRTVNQATSWSRASAITAGQGSVSAVAVHPADPNRVLVGMSDGFIHWNTAALSATGSTAWAFTQPRPLYVTSLAWDPANLDVAYATYASFSGVTVYKSTNSGQTWVPLPGTGGSTALPPVPAHSVVVNPDDSQQIYVGTDLGVFTSVDGGANWYVENTGFANTVVESLEVSETAPRYLYAFTHGRGAWRVTMSGGPTAPIAANDGYTTPFNTPLSVAPAGVLGNDSANGGGSMSTVLEAGPASGTTTLANDGGFTFTPATGFAGPVTFAYRAYNGGGMSNIATVTVTVGSPGTPPTSVADAYTYFRHDPLTTIPSPGVLANDHSNGGGAMTAVLVSQPTNGTVALNADGSFTYAPGATFVRPETFTYRAVNAAGPGAVATVSLYVAPPILRAVADTFSVARNTTLVVPGPGVLANDSKSARIRPVVVAAPTHGRLTLSDDGALRYRPTRGFSGTDTFTYRITDGQSTSNAATVTIEVVRRRR
jgi:Bacterial Ig domain